MEIRILRESASKRVLRQESLEEAIPFFDIEMVSHRSYLAAIESGCVVGLVSFVESSMRVPGALGVGFVSTHSGHRGCGVARRMLEALYELAAHENKPIAMSAYEPDGERWLRPLLAKLSLQNPHVRLFEAAS